MCRFACVDLHVSIWVWKICKKRAEISVFVFGETVMPGKTSQSTQEYPNRTARRSLTKDHRAMAQSGGTVPLDQGVK